MPPDDATVFGPPVLALPFTEEVAGGLEVDGISGFLAEATSGSEDLSSGCVFLASNTGRSGVIDFATMAGIDAVSLSFVASFGAPPVDAAAPPMTAAATTGAALFLVENIDPLRVS